MDMENNNKKLCKYCKSEIPADAKICPACRKKQGKSGCLIGVIVVVVLFVLIGIIGSGSEKESKEAESSAVSSQASSTENITSEEGSLEDEQAETEEKEYYTVGDVIDDNGVLIKILSAGQYVSDNQFLQPESGKIYYKIDFEFENTSDGEETISSIASFDAYEDGYSISQSYVSEESLDGTIAPGKKLSGSLVYEVSEQWQEIEVDYSGSMFSNNKITMKFFNE